MEMSKSTSIKIRIGMLILIGMFILRAYAEMLL